MDSLDCDYAIPSHNGLDSATASRAVGDRWKGQDVCKPTWLKQIRIGALKARFTLGQGKRSAGLACFCRGFGQTGFGDKGSES